MDFEPKEIIIWPNIQTEVDLNLFSSLKNLSKIFQDRPKRIVYTYNVDGEAGKIILCHMPPHYMGIWVPDRFNKLSKILETAFYRYYCDTSVEGSELIEFIDGFHSYRTIEPRAFTSFSDNELSLPPLWLLNNKQIEELAQMCNVEDVTTQFRASDIVQYIFKGLTSQQIDLIYSVPEEHKLTLSRILDKWISLLDRSEALRLFWHLQIYLAPVYPQEVQRFGVLFLERPEIYPDLTLREIEWVEEVGLHTDRLELKKRAYFLLGNYHSHHGDITRSIEYFRKVINLSSHDFVDIVTTRTQLNLARLFHSIGDYKNSSLHYSFALTFLKQLGRLDLISAAKLEYMNQRIGEAVNLLHAALYTVNSHEGKLQLPQAKILLEAVAKLLRLFTIIPEEQYGILKEFKQVTNQTINVLRIHLDTLNEIYDLDFTSLISLISVLIEGEKKTSLVGEAMRWSDILLKKKQHILKKIFVLMKDGRLLFEFDAKDKRLVRKIHTEDSMDLLFSSALSAVNIFLKDMISGEKVDVDVERIDMDGFSITVTEGRHIIFASIALHTPYELIAKIKELTRRFEEDFELELRTWTGDMSYFRDVERYISELNPFASEDSEIE